MAEIISIGTELLMGDITDTNSRYIASKLTENGYKVTNISMVADNLVNIINIMQDTLNRSDIIITTGGLGPTEDDLTRQAVAEALGIKLIKNPELVKHIKNVFLDKGFTLTKNNFRQAYLPEGAIEIKNKWGTAPGFILNSSDKTIISLPGVPYEMKKMFIESVLPLLNNNKNIIKTRILHVLGIGESLLEDKLADILYDTDNPAISLLVQKGEIDIRITATGKNENVVKNRIDRKEKKIRKRIGKYIYGSNGNNLPELAGNLLKKNNKSLSIAESCTGGLIGKRVTEIPGSSAYFMGGMVVYSNKAKIRQLNINRDTLATYGAVSSQTAEEMVENVRNIFSSDYAISVTGIAGPGGGSTEKPVGLVYIGVSNGKKNYIYKLNLPGNRQRIRWMSSQYALFYLYNILTGGN